MEIFPKILISGNYNVFNDGWSHNGGVYMCSGIIPSATFKLPIYIGGTKRDFQARIECEHIIFLDKNKHANPILQHSWNKYGKDNFVWWTLEFCEPTREAAIACEQKYLDLYRPFVDEFGGFNIGHNANGGRHFCSSETRKKMSNSYTEERRIEMSKRMSGENNPNFGKPFSEERKQELSKKNSGENSSWFGKNHTEETKNKISNAQKGEKNHAFGKPAINRKKIYQLDKNTNEIIKIWDSITNAADSLNIRLSNISRACVKNAKLKTPLYTSNGFKWIYS